MLIYKNFMSNTKVFELFIIKFYLYVKIYTIYEKMKKYSYNIFFLCKREIYMLSM